MEKIRRTLEKGIFDIGEVEEEQENEYIIEEFKKRYKTTDDDKT